MGRLAFLLANMTSITIALWLIYTSFLSYNVTLRDSLGKETYSRAETESIALAEKRHGVDRLNDFHTGVNAFMGVALIVNVCVNVLYFKRSPPTQRRA